MNSTNQKESYDAPNFAVWRVALRFILLLELIAIVIVIGRHEHFDTTTWLDLNLLLAYALTLAFLAIVVFMLSAPLFRRMSIEAGLITTYLVLLLISLAATELMVLVLFDTGYITERWPLWRESFRLRALFITAIVGIPALSYLAMVYRLEADARTKQEATMQALQSRIRPHFLFNSLNSVATLTRRDPERAEAILHDIADLFRVLLADARKLVSISAEREISRQYLEVEKVRLGDRLKIQWNVKQVPRSALIPALILQPLLENAIYHGIEPRFAGGTIAIDLWTENDRLNIMITNPLPERSAASPSKGNKIAQENIRQRLATQFGNAASMESFQHDGLYRVHITMPIITDQ